MCLISKNIIEFEDLSIQGQNYFEKVEDITLVLIKDLRRDIKISRCNFKANIKNVDRIINIENRDLYIYHIEVVIDMEYLENEISSSIKIENKKYLLSKIIDVKHINGNSELSSNISVINGVLSIYDNILYSNILLLLSLGGGHNINK